MFSVYGQAGCLTCQHFSIGEGSFLYPVPPHYRLPPHQSIPFTCQNLNFLIQKKPKKTNKQTNKWD